MKEEINGRCCPYLSPIKILSEKKLNRSLVCLEWGRAKKAE